MVDSTIVSYTAGSALVGSEIFEGVLSPFGAGDDRKWTATQIKTFVETGDFDSAGNISSALDVGVGAAAYLYWTDGGSLIFAGNSLLLSGAADLELVQLGGATAAFPAIRRNAAGIDFTLADNSALTSITAKSISLTGGTITANDPIINATRTWNNAGVTFTAVRYNVTDTASDASSLLLDLQTNGGSRFRVTKGGAVEADANILSGSGIIGGPSVQASAGGYIYWLGRAEMTSPDSSTVKINANAGATVGASFQLFERTAPAAPAANSVYLYAVDNGSGKTQLMALFASGAAQQVAIEP